MHIISLLWLHRINTCNKLLINECGMIRQVFVIWFDSGGDDASHHGVDSSPCRINPIRSIDGLSPTSFFCFIIANHEFFNRKFKKYHVICTITIRWKNWSAYLYSHYKLRAHRTTICQMKNIYFNGLKSLSLHAISFMPTAKRDRTTENNR